MDFKKNLLIFEATCKTYKAEGGSGAVTHNGKGGSRVLRVGFFWI